MTRAKGRPVASADILAELMQNRRLERLAKQHGRWDERRRAEHAKKVKRTKRAKQTAALLAKRQPKHPLLGHPNQLSLAERVTLHMLPGEWLTLNDVAERMQLTCTRPINPILHQRLLVMGIAVKAAISGMPEEEHKIWRVIGVPMNTRVFALTIFGCAVRAALLQQVAVPETTPPVDPKIPRKFLEHFQIEVSGFLGGVGTAVRGTGSASIAAKRAAWARVAAAHGAADPFLPAEW